MIKEYTIGDVITRAPGKYDRQFASWHKTLIYTLPGTDAKIQISDMFGGCGMQQIHNWSGSQDIKGIELCLSKLLLELDKETLGWKPGLIMCQIGNSYYNSRLEKALINEGFELQIEYDNLAHMDGDTQRIYFLKRERQTDSE